MKKEDFILYWKESALKDWNAVEQAKELMECLINKLS